MRWKASLCGHYNVVQLLLESGAFPLFISALIHGVKIGIVLFPPVSSATAMTITLSFKQTYRYILSNGSA